MTTGDQQKQRSVIEKSVFGRIIPALLAKAPVSGSMGAEGASSARRAAKVSSRPMVAPQQNTLKPDAVQAFALLLLTGDTEKCEDHFSNLRAANIPVATLFLDLFAPASALLGEAWLQDEAGFGDVTAGMSIVHSLFHRHSVDLYKEVDAAPRQESVYIMPLPKGQHVFGATMVETFFRAHGWDVYSGVYQDEHAALDAVSNGHFDMIGISFSIHEDVPRCTDFIRNLRKASRNRDLGIMVGGPPLLERPDLYLEVGADLTASNAQEAVERAAQFVDATKAGTI